LTIHLGQLLELGLLSHVGVADETEQRFRHLLRRQNEVDHAGRDRMAGHVAEAGRPGVLRHRYPAFRLDGTQALRATGARS